MIPDLVDQMLADYIPCITWKLHLHEPVEQLLAPYLIILCFLLTDGESKLGEDVHAPPTNLADIKRQDDLRHKMALIREKRKINQKLG